MGHGRNQKDKRYYNGVDYRRTTRCCSAVALIVSLSASVWAQPPTPRSHPTPKPRTAKVDRTPFPLMPIDTVWALALNNTLTWPPAYEGTHAFLAIDGDRLVAYDLISGTQEWTVTARPLMEPVAGDGLLFILEADVLKALHVADGSVAWQIPLSDTLTVHPVWDNGWLIVASDSGEIGALRATDGQVVWRRDLKSPAHALPALAADRVYIPTADSRIVALGVESGEPIWERRLGGAPNDILALNDRLFAGSQDNFFYCVMAADGRVDWRWRTGGDVVGRPVSDERYVYFVALDNVLRAMNMVSGGQQWMRPLPMRPAWGPVKVGSTIVVAGQAAPIRAFNIKDGVAAGTLAGVTQPPEVPAADAPAGAAADAPAKKTPQRFLPLDANAEVAAAPHVLQHPLTRAPLVLLLFKDIAKGASATLVVHSLEPVLIPVVAALPNLIQIAPVTPTTPPPRH
jgi:outer membrane protein assembly factor BamB